MAAVAELPGSVCLGPARLESVWQAEMVMLEPLG